MYRFPASVKSGDALAIIAKFAKNNPKIMTNTSVFFPLFYSIFIAGIQSL
jgi:hypothetical protein